MAAKWRYATGRPTDVFIVHEDVFSDPDFRRFSKEITTNNADRLARLSFGWQPGLVVEAGESE